MEWRLAMVESTLLSSIETSSDCLNDLRPRAENVRSYHSVIDLQDVERFICRCAGFK